MHLTLADFASVTTITLAIEGVEEVMANNGLCHNKQTRIALTFIPLNYKKKFPTFIVSKYKIKKYYDCIVGSYTRTWFPCRLSDN